MKYSTYVLLLQQTNTFRSEPVSVGIAVQKRYRSVLNKDHESFSSIHSKMTMKASC